MFNIYLGIYIVLSIAIILGGTFNLYKMDQPIGAFLFFAGSITIISLFGVRWFGEDKSLFSKTPVSWPPTINTCPDYLIHYSRTKSDGTKEDTCVDMIGVSKNGTLSVFPNSETAPVNDNYYFSLVTATSDPVKRKAELCQRALTYGLTWEGITNGESCTIPSELSGTSISSSGSGSGEGCPST